MGGETAAPRTQRKWGPALLPAPCRRTSAPTSSRFRRCGAPPGFGGNHGPAAKQLGARCDRSRSSRPESGAPRLSPDPATAGWSAVNDRHRDTSRMRFAMPVERRSGSDFGTLRQAARQLSSPIAVPLDDHCGLPRPPAPNIHPRPLLFRWFPSGNRSLPTSRCSHQSRVAPSENGALWPVNNGDNGDKRARVVARGLLLVASCRDVVSGS